MNDWNNLFFFNEADDEEEKKKNKEESDKDEEKKDSKKDEDKKEKDKSEEYNDLIDDKIEDESEEKSDDEDEYNDLMDDDLDIDDESEDSTESDSSEDSDYNTLVVVKTGEDSSDDSLYDSAAKVGYAFTVISNNMKHIHVNACGPNFNEIHSMTNELMYRFSSIADYYYELAAESPLTTLDNPIRAKEHCEDISVEVDKEYDFKKAFETITSNIESGIKYLGDLRSAANNRPDVLTRLDDELCYLNKQSRYFIRKRLIEPSSSVSAAMENYNSLL